MAAREKWYEGADEDSKQMRVCKIVAHVVLPILEASFMIVYWLVGIGYYY